MELRKVLLAATAIAFVCAMSAAAVPGAALAADASPASNDGKSDASKSDAGKSTANTSFGVLSGDWQNANFLGDVGGARPAIAKYGITLSLTVNAEAFGNASGGVRQGFEANGLTTATLQWNTQPLFGLAGGLLNVSGMHIYGGQLSAANLLNLQTVTGIEAAPSLRLWELWYQQKFNDVFDVKIGEQSLDQEFMTSQSASAFLNSAMGWGALPALNLPAGGPAYPLASLGVRGRAHVSDQVTVVGGVFSGTPVPLYSTDGQLSNPNGVSFPLAGVLAIAELQYAFGTDSSGKPLTSGPLPGTYKIGAWYDNLSFDSQQYDTIGVPLASPDSNGVPAGRQGNYSIYALADQTIWRAADPNRFVTAFVRPMFTTLQDRNLISFSINGGLTLHQPFAGRDNDTFGLGFGVVQVSDGARNFDRQTQFYQPDNYTPVRGAETFIEATYQMQLLPSVQIQPDVQYVINPGAGIANPNEPYQKVKNEWVLGLRTNITF